MMEPGIHFAVPASVYFSDPMPRPSLTQSIAKLLIDRSPKHAWHAHPRLNPNYRHDDDDYTAAKAIGNAAHKLVLERGKEIVVIEAPDFRTKEARSTRDAVTAEGKVPILIKHYGRAVKMAAIATERLRMLGLTADGASEVVLGWEEGGTWFRSMIDRLSADRRTIIDYKTTGSCCAPYVVGRLMAEAGWDLQAAMHERGLNVLDPDSAGRRRHIFVAQENEEPFDLAVCELSESVMTMGRKRLAAAVNLWRMCSATNNWPGYIAKIIAPEYPAYKEFEWLDREENEFSGRDARDLYELARRKDEGEPLGGHPRAIHNILMGG